MTDVRTFIACDEDAYLDLDGEETPPLADESIYDTLPGGGAFDPFDDSKINLKTTTVHDLLSDDVFAYNRNHEGKTPLSYHTRKRVDMNFCDDDKFDRATEDICLGVDLTILVGINPVTGDSDVMRTYCFSDAERRVLVPDHWWNIGETAVSIVNQTLDEMFDLTRLLTKDLQ